MTHTATIRIGTRASTLALWQAEYVKSALVNTHPTLSDVSMEIVPMTTKGDKQQEGTLAEWGYKGLFTKEIEDALLTGAIDIAVHSLKDMPSTLPAGLILGAYLPREDPRDALILHEGKTIDDIPKGAVFGTASLRRGAQLKQMRPDLELVPLRGNVQTRLRKVQEGEVAGTMLALAGLKRLGLEHEATEIFTPNECLPAVSQGIIAVECRAADISMLGILAGVSDEQSYHAATAERAMLRELDGSCHTPIAGYAVIENELLTLSGKVLSENGIRCAEASMSGPVGAAEKIGVALGTELRKDAHDFLPSLAEKG